MEGDFLMDHPVILPSDVISCYIALSRHLHCVDIFSSALSLELAKLKKRFSKDPHTKAEHLISSTIKVYDLPKSHL